MKYRGYGDKYSAHYRYGHQNAVDADLKNNLSFTSQCSREWQREFAQDGYKIGSQLMIRKTPKFIVQSGAGFVAQDYVEEFVPLVVDQQKHVDVEFGSVEMTLSLDDWNRRIGNPDRDSARQRGGHGWPRHLLAGGQCHGVPRDGGGQMVHLPESRGVPR